jgi:hypothetical protein
MSDIQKYVSEFIELNRLIMKQLKFYVSKYWYFLLLPYLILGVFSFYKYQSTSTFYKVESSYSYNYLHKKYYGEQILKTQELINFHKNSDLQKQFDLSPELVENIISIGATNVFNKPLHEDLTDIRLPFYIKLNLHSDTAIDLYEKAVLDLFNKNSFAKKHINRVNEDRRIKVQSLNEQINYLDSAIFKNPTKNQFKTAADFEKILALKEQKETERSNTVLAIKRDQAVELLNPMLAIPVSKMSQFKPWFLKGLILCILSSMIFVLSIAALKYKND